MNITKITSLSVATVIAISVCGCSGQMVQTAYGPMPQYCTQNNTATGAVLGALIGGAIGAAAGGGRGAAIGAASGLALGGLTGAQADTQCRQLAMQQFMQLMAQQAAARQAALSRGAPVQPVQYESVDYVSPSTGKRNRITQTNSYTNPTTKETCSSYSSVSFSDDNKGTVTGNGRICTGADGKPRES
jgi:hypothetical protein